MSSLIDRLERRDLEVLRTLARVRYATKKELQKFFTSDPVARKRLRFLSGLDLVRTHTKGLPEQFGYYAWRLTALGVEVVAQAFPDELIRDGLAEQLGDASLYNLQHREVGTSFYLDLIAGPASQPPEAADVTAVRQWIDRVRARASQLVWQGDGDIKLRHRVIKSDPRGRGELVHDEQVQPDATVVGIHRRERVFIEMDCSTHGHARIRQALERYRRFLAEQYTKDFKDGRAPAVLLVVPSEARRTNLAKLSAQILGPVTHAVLQRRPAVAWLADRLLDAARLEAAVVASVEPDATAPRMARADVAPVADELRTVAIDVYRSMKTYRESLQQQRADLPADLLRTYRSLREVLRKEKEAGHAG